MSKHRHSVRAPILKNEVMYSGLNPIWVRSGSDMDVTPIFRSFERTSWFFDSAAVMRCFISRPSR